uniref:Uncharacterized protein n=1 Tax=Arundo donax TaxID=35708 RepID=A0A0A9HQX9_ARUDO
MRRLGAALFR